MINFRYLEEVSGGDAGFVREMAEAFLEQIQRAPGKFMEHLNAGRLGLMAHDAHFLRSSVMLFGMDALAVQLKNLEVMSEKGAAESDLPLLISRIGEMITSAEEELRCYLAGFSEQDHREQSLPDNLRSSCP